MYAHITKNLKEIRLHICQSSPGSAGARDFILKSYPKIKLVAPHFPVLIREAAGVEARVFGRYAKGVEREINLEGLSEKQVEEQFKTLIGQ